MQAAVFSDFSFWVFLGLAVLGVAAAGCGRAAWARAVGLAALLAGLAFTGGVCAQTGRPPLGGALESLGYMALVLATLAFGSQFGPGANRPLVALAWGAVVLLLFILVWVPRRVNPDWFIYHYTWNRAFFMCRLLAMPLLFYSALIALAWPGRDGDGEMRRLLITRSRRFLLLGTAVFLLGEVSGFYWCLSWRGDYWLWNRNFLESTMIFLLASAALHLPPKLAANPRALRLAYGPPGLLGMGAFLVHQVTESFL
ncbi:MAG: hypothetical protein AB1814_16770 [Thermodesulfobacteriota bacterium]